MVQVFTGRFTNSEIYSIAAFVGHEDDGSEISVKWVDISELYGKCGVISSTRIIQIVENSE